MDDSGAYRGVIIFILLFVSLIFLLVVVIAAATVAAAIAPAVIFVVVRLCVAPVLSSRPGIIHISMVNMARGPRRWPGASLHTRERPSISLNETCSSVW